MVPSAVRYEILNGLAALCCLSEDLQDFRIGKMNAGMSWDLLRSDLRCRPQQIWITTHSDGYQSRRYGTGGLPMRSSKSQAYSSKEIALAPLGAGYW
jgi:hypothetical protein